MVKCETLVASAREDVDRPNCGSSNLPCRLLFLRANLPAGGGGESCPKFRVGPLAGLVILTECDRIPYANWSPEERDVPLVLCFVGVRALAKTQR